MRRAKQASPFHRRSRQQKLGWHSQTHSTPKWPVTLGHCHLSPPLSCKTSAPKAATRFSHCLKRFGMVGLRSLEAVRALPGQARSVTISGKMHYNYSNPASNCWVCAPHGPLYSHRFDFIYDLFEHVSSRNNQDTLKCGSKHRRPTVSSQFKVSLHCWLW